MTQLTAVCLGSSYLQDCPLECQVCSAALREAADERLPVIFKPSLTHRQFMFMEYGAGDSLKPKCNSSYAYPGQT